MLANVQLVLLVASLTKLSRQLAINSCAGPVVRPRNVSVLAQGNHGFNSKGHSRLAFADCLVLGVVWDIGRAVEQLADSVAAVGSDDTAVLLLGVLLDDVSKLPDQGTGLHSLDGLLQALSCRLDDTDGVRVRLGPVTNVICLVQIGMVAFVVEGNVDVENIAVEENTLIGDTVADDFVDGCTA